ncbi:MAG TPA: hypothetical protein VHP56_05955, partial [Solirubrobacterales bacterium]|nr:hypothetical protein [Solirubrobacterales bacterium]
GKKGLLENSEDLCASVHRADVRFSAQNGRTLNSRPVLAASCGKKGKGKGGKGHRRTVAWFSGLGF